MNSIIILSVTGMVVLFAGLFNYRRLALPLAIAGLLLAIGFNFADWNTNASFYNEMVLIDNFAASFSAVLSFVTVLVLLLASHYFRAETEHLADIYSLIIFSLAGGVIMVCASNLVMFFIGLEALSIPLYILAASNRNNLQSNEAGVKYFILGSFSTCFVILGMAFVFGSANTFNLATIKAYVAAQNGNIPSMFSLGVLLLFVGFSFKISAAPFHFWAPDVYQGAPTAITSFMATVVKSAAIGALLRFSYLGFGGDVKTWSYTLTVFAVLTMTIGSVTALYQTNFKRFLAYSGISNAGYLLLPIISSTPTADEAVLYYILVYSIGTLTAFTVFSMIRHDTNRYDINMLKGLSRKNPLMATALAIAMFSLAGIPPLSGFFAKYYLFTNAIAAGNLWVVIVAVITSVIGVYYYLRLTILMFSKEDSTVEIHAASVHNVLLVICIIAIVVLGIFPSLVAGLLA